MTVIDFPVPDFVHSPATSPSGTYSPVFLQACSTQWIALIQFLHIANSQWGGQQKRFPYNLALLQLRQTLLENARDRAFVTFAQSLHTASPSNCCHLEKSSDDFVTLQLLHFRSACPYELLEQDGGVTWCMCLALSAFSSRYCVDISLISWFDFVISLAKSARSISLRLFFETLRIAPFPSKHTIRPSTPLLAPLVASPKSCFCGGTIETSSLKTIIVDLSSNSISALFLSICLMIAAVLSRFNWTHTRSLNQQGMLLQSCVVNEFMVRHIFCLLPSSASSSVSCSYGSAFTNWSLGGWTAKASLSYSRSVATFVSAMSLVASFCCAKFESSTVVQFPISPACCCFVVLVFVSFWLLIASDSWMRPSHSPLLV